MSTLSTKAQTLQNLHSKLSQFIIPKLLIIETHLFAANRDDVLDSIQKQFYNRQIVVRSSANDEDSEGSTLAGEYESVLNVNSSDRAAISDAIETVIDSFKKKLARADGVDEVFIQEMVLNSSMSGVVFTHDLNTGAPYYVVNYDDVSGLTDTVTSGGGEYANRTLYIYRGALDSLRSERFQRLVEAIKELEVVMSNKFLDIEFALGHDFTPYLFQVRSIRKNATD